MASYKEYLQGQHYAKNGSAESVEQYAKSVIDNEVANSKQITDLERRIVELTQARDQLQAQGMISSVASYNKKISKLQDKVKKIKGKHRPIKMSVTKFKTIKANRKHYNDLVKNLYVLEDEFKKKFDEVSYAMDKAVKKAYKKELKTNAYSTIKNQFTRHIVSVQELEIRINNMKYYIQSLDQVKAQLAQRQAQQQVQQQPQQQVQQQAQNQQQVQPAQQQARTMTLDQLFAAYSSGQVTKINDTYSYWRHPSGLILLLFNEKFVNINPATPVSEYIYSAISEENLQRYIENQQQVQQQSSVQPSSSSSTTQINNNSSANISDEQKVSSVTADENNINQKLSDNNNSSKRHSYTDFFYLDYFYSNRVDKSLTFELSTTGDILISNDMELFYGLELDEIKEDIEKLKSSDDIKEVTKPSSSGDGSYTIKSDGTLIIREGTTEFVTSVDDLQKKIDEAKANKQSNNLEQNQSGNNANHNVDDKTDNNKDVNDKQPAQEDKKSSRVFTESTNDFSMTLYDNGNLRFSYKGNDFSDASLDDILKVVAANKIVYDNKVKDNSLKKEAVVAKNFDLGRGFNTNVLSNGFVEIYKGDKLIHKFNADKLQIFISKNKNKSENITKDNVSSNIDKALDNVKNRNTERDNAKNALINFVKEKMPDKYGSLESYLDLHTKDQRGSQGNNVEMLEYWLFKNIDNTNSALLSEALSNVLSTDASKIDVQYEQLKAISSYCQNVATAISFETFGNPGLENNKEYIERRKKAIDARDAAYKAKEEYEQAKKQMDVNSLIQDSSAIEGNSGRQM